MKILVISLAGIGDTLFATPLIHELRLNFPEAVVEALVLWPGSRDILSGNPHLNRVHQENLIRLGYFGSARFLWGLRRAGYDLSINTHPQSRIHYRLAAFLAGARSRISHDYENSSVADRVLVTRSVLQDYSLHCIENNLQLLKLAQARPLLSWHEYEIYFSMEELAWADRFIATQSLAGARLLGIHVGSGGTKNLALRRWPVGSYIELVKLLNRRQPDLRILLFGGPDEQEANQTILAQAKSPLVILPKTGSLRQAAALVRKCHGFLSVDTAFMHLAAAAKVPGQVIIETPSWNRPIQPHNQSFTLVKNPSLAEPNLKYYRYDGKGIQGTDTEITGWMASVSVEAVYRAVVRALQIGE